MNILSRNTDYAVRALVYMAGKAPARVSTADLHRYLRLPRPFMRRILQQLQKAGLLSSIKGKNGGFSLAVAPDKLRLVGLIELFQGKVSMSECLFRNKLCANRNSCPLRREIKSIEAMALAKLSKITIATLMKDVYKVPISKSEGILKVRRLKVSKQNSNTRK